MEPFWRRILGVVRDQTPRPKDFFQQSERAAVKVRRCDDLIPRAEQSSEDCGGGGQARGKGQPTFAFLQRGQRCFQFKEGLIYPRLHQMEQEGLLRSDWVGEPGSRRRRVYAVTEQGSARLQAEMEHWQSFRLGMDRLLGLSDAKG